MRSEDPADRAFIEMLLANKPQMSRTQVETLNRLWFSTMGQILDWDKYVAMCGECPHCHHRFERVSAHIASRHAKEGK